MIRLEVCEPGLSLSPVPAWVLAIDPLHMCWVNDAALEFWQAKDRAELFGRDMVTGAPARVTARLDNAILRVRTGEVVREDWTFYPRGQPVLVLLHIRGIVLPDGKLALLNLVEPIGSELPPQVERTLNMSRNTAFIVAFLDARGEVLTRNPAAMAAFGETPTWREWLDDPSQADPIVEAALAGEVVQTRLRVRVGDQLRWHLIDAQMLRDPVTGEMGVLVEHKDETDRIAAEQLAETRAHRIDTLNSTLALVEQQRREILSLSAPILDVGEQTLAMPIIGRLNETLSVDIMAQLLHAVGERRARNVILDLTGVVAIDGPSMARLRQMLRSLRLLGARATITGIRPELAREFVESGFDVEATTLRSLAEGLAHVSRTATRAGDRFTLG
jgi:anti-anti-sigma regulatory factor/PAS domain-containing protein